MCEVLPQNARVTVAALLAVAAAAAAAPIPQGPNADALRAFAGHAVAPRPQSAPSPQRHPHRIGRILRRMVNYQGSEYGLWVYKPYQ
jgi:hypothetical protein